MRVLERDAPGWGWDVCPKDPPYYTPQMAFLGAEGMPVKASRSHSLPLSVPVLFLLPKL